MLIVTLTFNDTRMQYISTHSYCTGSSYVYVLFILLSTCIILTMYCVTNFYWLIAIWYCWIDICCLEQDAMGPILFDPWRRFVCWFLGFAQLVFSSFLFCISNFSLLKSFPSIPFVVTGHWSVSAVNRRKFQ